MPLLSTRSILIIRSFLFSMIVGLCSCNSANENRISSTTASISQVDSSEFKHVAASYTKGKQLFSKFCNACHYAPERHVLDQYIFDDLFKRLPPRAEDYFVKYISDSKLLKLSGNKYAKQVDKVWNNPYEHKFKDSLSKQDFNNLIIYIKIAAKQRY